MSQLFGLATHCVQVSRSKTLGRARAVLATRNMTEKNIVFIMVTLWF